MPKRISGSLYYSISEVARRFGVTDACIHNQEKNGRLIPDLRAGKRNTRYYLETSINDFVEKYGIPKSKKRSKETITTLFPDLIEEWDFEKNIWDPSTVRPHSSINVFWVCKNCGNRWSSRLDSRTEGNHGCPVCAKGRGKSVPDYTLYLLCQHFIGMDGVFYRCKSVAGVETDVFIEKYNIAIEYDGYYYHNGREEDAERKREKLKKHGVTLFSIKERKDRNMEVTKKENVFFLPEFSLENFEFLKKHLLFCLSEIFCKELIEDDWLQKLSLSYVVSFVSRPPFDKSIAFYLKDSGLLWSDFNQAKPENLYADQLRPRIYLQCGRGHLFDVEPRHLVRGYGCPICSGRRYLGDNPFQISYNLSLAVEDFKNKLLEGVKVTEFYDKFSKNSIFTCPFCKEEYPYSIRWILGSKGLSDHCFCTMFLNEHICYIVVLGKDSLGAIYYCLVFLNQYFLIKVKPGSSDFVMEKLGLHREDISALDEDLFKRSIGDPYNLRPYWNSLNTVPLYKKNKDFVNATSQENIRECLRNLNRQMNGLPTN